MANREVVVLVRCVRQSVASVGPWLISEASDSQVS